MDSFGGLLGVVDGGDAAGREEAEGVGKFGFGVFFDGGECVFGWFHDVFALGCLCFGLDVLGFMLERENRS